MTQTIIEIDLKGGLVQEVRVNQPEVSVLVIDYDALEVGEDPRITLAAEFDPTLGPSDESESPEPEYLNDDEILERAAHITNARHAARLVEDQAEVKRLYKLYGKAIKLEHELGKPKKLSMVEALLVAALERTRYVVSAECPNSNRWHGDAACIYGVQDTVIVMMQDSRLELLWEIWRSVSDQPAGHVTLTEAHLQGSVCRQHLRELSREVHDVRNV